MKILATLTLAAAMLPAHAVTNIGVSIGINAPGQYGRINIDNYPQPVLVMPQPIIYAPTPQATYQRPIYLYVPSAHRSNWGRYCASYRACGQPVFFVQEHWVRDEYRREHEQRQYRQPRRDDDDHDRDRDDDRGKGKSKSYYKDKGDDNGHEKGHGRGHGK